MARPKKSGVSKNIVVSCGCTIEQKQMLIDLGVTPTQLFQQAFKNLEKQKGVVSDPFERDIEVLRKYYLQGIKPEGDINKYYQAVDLFLKKYPDWSKAEVMLRAERPRFVALEKTEVKDFAWFSYG